MINENTHKISNPGNGETFYLLTYNKIFEGKGPFCASGKQGLEVIVLLKMCSYTILIITAL